MECKLIVAIVLHLLYNRTPNYLLRAHSIGSRFNVVHMLGEVLPGQLMYGRDMVKDSADEFQLHRMWMVNARRGQRHLFLFLFARFLVAPFFFLHVISVDYSSFITE
ncbi:MAG: hypothetical protein JSV55_03210 [Deltaproteobacteria bacterium]|nr:MAG: hypothetical protein JSV55_03210 [Deltaproteobacteria bacterium]